MTIAEEVTARGVRELLHFTTNNGLLGSLASGHLKSRPLLKVDEYLKKVIHYNSQTRIEESAYFDKQQDWISFVNLSISEINRRFFGISEGWHIGKDKWWSIMSFDPVIMIHDGVWFTTTNNSYDGCIRRQGLAGFIGVFDNPILRKRWGMGGVPWYAYRANRAARLPTCEQAEVLYPGQVSMEYLRAVYVREDDQADIVGGWLEEYGPEGVAVCVDRGRFNGVPN